MTKDEALKMALEALKRATNYDPVIARAITAIKEALMSGTDEAQPEPLQWIDKMVIDVPNQPLYTAPQRKPLPAHEIVTMYDESPTSDSDMIAFARAIEAAHGIKGNYVL